MKLGHLLLEGNHQQQELRECTRIMGPRFSVTGAEEGISTKQHPQKPRAQGEQPVECLGQTRC